MNEIFEKIYNDNNTDLNESSALFEKVYTEAEMLNEMNPKLRALLAAGLIGTAGLGAVSCSMPTDDPTGYEQPASETPSNPDNSNPDDPGDNGGGQETVTFESLGVADYAESLARAVKDLNAGSFNVIKDLKDLKAGSTDIIDLIYDNGFVPVEFDRDGEYSDGQSYIRYIDVSDKIVFNVPVSMESDLDTAIAAYNNAQ